MLARCLCICVSLFISVYLCVSLRISVYLCVSVYMCISVSLSLCVSMYLCVSVYLGICYLCVSVHLCIDIHAWISTRPPSTPRHTQAADSRRCAEVRDGVARGQLCEVLGAWFIINQLGPIQRPSCLDNRYDNNIKRYYQKYILDIRVKNINNIL